MMAVANISSIISITKHWRHCSSHQIISPIIKKMYAPLSISRAKEKVYMNYTFAQAGHRYRERAVSLSARGKADEVAGIFWEYQKIDNYLLISVNHLNSTYIGKIVDEILQWKPKTFYGYPSAISMFIRACKSIGIEKIEGISGTLTVWSHIIKVRSSVPLLIIL